MMKFGLEIAHNKRVTMLSNNKQNNYNNVPLKMFEEFSPPPPRSLSCYTVFSGTIDNG